MAGAQGLKRAKECGGLTIAQDPDEVQHDALPHSALATNMVDWVLEAANACASPSICAAATGCASRPRRARSPRSRSASQQARTRPRREVLAFLRARTRRDLDLLQASHHPPPHLAADGGQ
jgi:two-component system, chemotaxis family, CheB/CheR fusion protein